MLDGAWAFLLNNNTLQEYFNMNSIWITGASSGIGEALAREYSALGWRVILSSRRAEELLRVANTCASPENCTVIPLDLEDPKSIDEAADDVIERFGTVDILVNNGGISQRSLVHETPIEIDRKIMQIDYLSGVQLTKRILPAMITAGGGHIVAISSIVGVFGFPQRSAYSAAKHAIHGFYESVWAELHTKGIQTTIVCPGQILTNVSLHALTKDGSEHGKMDPAQKNGIPADECAHRIRRAIEHNKREVYVCRIDVLMCYFHRYARWIYYKLVSKVSQN